MSAEDTRIAPGGAVGEAAEEDRPPPTAAPFELEVSRPFRLDLTAWALRRRPDNAVDRWDETGYRRVMTVGGLVREVSVRQEGPASAGRLSVLLSGRPPAPADAAEVRAVLGRLLGFERDLSAFYRFAARDRKLGPLAMGFRGLRPPRFPSLFECLANAIACQQVSLQVGILLANRLAEAFGPALEVRGSRVHGFPRPETLAAAEPEEVRGLGFSRQKAAALVELARAVSAGRVDLDGLEGLSNEDAVRRLGALRGVGRWSAEYALLRGLGRLEVFPWGDAGARNGLARWLGVEEPLGYDQVQSLVTRWRPFGGMIYFHLLLARLSDQGHLA
jgi:DNA-3-methyladenine glycosylase II